MELLQLQRTISGVQPEIVFKIFDYSVSNTMMLILLIVVLMISLSFFVIRKFKTIPSKSQSLIEIMYEGVYSLVNQVTGNKKITDRVFPISAAIFFYVITSNLIGTFLPGLTSITYDGVALFRTPTSDFNTTFSLAIGAIIITHIASIVDWGFFGHLGKFFQFKEVYQAFRRSPSEGGMSLVGLFVGILDIIGEFAKVVSLSLRLFGNLYAGEVLMVVIFGGLAFVLPALWMAMSTLSGIVQAVVFCLLFTSYFTSAVRPVEEG